VLIPLQTIGVCAGATVFVVMLSVGLSIPLERLGYLWHTPWPLARGALSVLVLVPLLALLVVTHVDLPVPVRTGIMVMAISPGAPIALRRSLEAGAHDAFAPCLQLVVVTLAIVTIPLSIEFLDILYFGNARADPLAIARQVFFAQLLPLALGIGLRSVLPAFALRAEGVLARAGNLLFLLLAAVIVVSVWTTAIGVGLLAIACAIGLSVASIGIGLLLGSPDPATRPGMAVVSAMRNPGLALLLASANNAVPGVVAMILAYLLCSATVVVAYVLWRRKVGGP
jgi:BASS family bile acid:Na+ symporter